MQVFRIRCINHTLPTQLHCSSHTAHTRISCTRLNKQQTMTKDRETRDRTRKNWNLNVCRLFMFQFLHRFRAMDAIHEHSVQIPSVRTLTPYIYCLAYTFYMYIMWYGINPAWDDGMGNSLRSTQSETCLGVFWFVVAAAAMLRVIVAAVVDVRWILKK